MVSMMNKGEHGMTRVNVMDDSSCLRYRRCFEAAAAAAAAASVV